MQRVIAVGAVLAIAGAASADFDLWISEIWCGNEPGNNLTEDWFEITNMGDSPWVAGVDGALWYDDESLDPGDAVQIAGVDMIAPGESVILVDGGEDGANEWSTLWSDVVSLPQVGWYDGAGLSQGGDAVGIWVGDAAGDPYAIAAYPDANDFGGQSYDTIRATFSTAGDEAGSVATLVVNDEGQAAVGSPGYVPSPAGAALLSLAGLGCLRRRH